MSPFHSSGFPESIALATDESLTIGTIDDIQKLHIKSIPLGEMPNKIEHQKESGTLGVLTEKTEGGITTHYFKLLDDQTFEVLQSMALHPTESGISVTNIRLTGDSTESIYYAVGTAYVRPEETQPKRGRIIIFNAMDGKLKQVCEVSDTKGAVYTMKELNGKLIAGVNSKLQLYRWNDNDGNAELSLECSAQCRILAVDIVTRGEFIIVGDLMKGVSLHLYKPPHGEDKDGSVEEIATDNGGWVTAVQFIDEETALVMDHNYNLTTTRRNSGAATDEERQQLSLCGQYHTGEFINRIRPGSLVMKAVENEGLSVPTLLWGAISGAVGVVATLTAEQYEYFFKVQKQLSSTIKGVGGFTHNQWRSFHTDRRTSEATNVLDGDLIESYLDLPAAKMQEVAKALDTTIEELSREIETLQRAIH